MDSLIYQKPKTLTKFINDIQILHLHSIMCIKIGAKAVCKRCRMYYLRQIVYYRGSNVVRLISLVEEKRWLVEESASRKHFSFSIRKPGSLD